jgi:hypothetical protein
MLTWTLPHRQATAPRGLRENRKKEPVSRLDLGSAVVTIETRVRQMERTA